MALLLMPNSEKKRPTPQSLQTHRRYQAVEANQALSKDCQQEFRELEKIITFILEKEFPTYLSDLTCLFRLVP